MNQIRYLLTCNCQPPALTHWFEPENHFNPDVEMVVYDLQDCMYYDGTGWHEIQIDHL